MRNLEYIQRRAARFIETTRVQNDLTLLFATAQSMSALEEEATRRSMRLVDECMIELQARGHYAPRVELW